MMDFYGKLLIFSAPSGSGKSTIVQHLVGKGFNLSFSISATSRTPRGNEQEGVEYYFMSPETFRQRIEKHDFIEYEEVYPDCFYGTLKSEIDRISASGKHVVLDVDVVGGINIKKMYGHRALSIFIQPPSLEALKQRLINRATDSPEKITQRVAKAAHELTFAPQFDVVLVNDDLATCKAEAEILVSRFLQN